MVVPSFGARGAARAARAARVEDPATSPSLVTASHQLQPSPPSHFGLLQRMSHPASPSGYNRRSRSLKRHSRLRSYIRFVGLFIHFLFHCFLRQGITSLASILTNPRQPRLPQTSSYTNSSLLATLPTPLQDEARLRARYISALLSLVV